MPVPVAPGDAMWCYASKTSTVGAWTIHLQDLTQDWSFQSNVRYRGPGVSTDWIQEATQVNGVIGTPPAFSPAVFSNLEVDVAGRWYDTRLTSAADGMAMRDNGRVYAAPSEPSKTAPQTFNVSYQP